VMGLDDPTQKMSKSATGLNHAVALLDAPAKIRKTIMRATTDSLPAVDFETAGPGVLNLLSIYQAFSGEPDDTMQARFTGMRYGDLKKQVAEMAIAHLEPFQQRYREITADPAYLAAILREGAERVAPIANRNYRLLWIAQIVSELGDWFYTLAVYNLLLDLTGSKAQAVGLAVVLQVLPSTFAAPTAGVLNDR